MSISAVTNYIPSRALASPVQVVKNLKYLALPIIAMVGAMKAPVANAITYEECFMNCRDHRDAHPIAVLICQILCRIFAE